MAENKQDGITVFDTLFTNNRICILKIILPFLPRALQRNFAVYIKYLELQYTLQFLSKHPQGFSLSPDPYEDHSVYSDAIWEHLLPYCSPGEKQNIQQMRSMMQTFQSMKDMMEMMDTMKELFPDGFGSTQDMGFPTDFSSEGMGFSPELLNQINGLFNMNIKKGEQNETN